MDYFTRLLYLCNRLRRGEEMALHDWPCQHLSVLQHRYQVDAGSVRHTVAKNCGIDYLAYSTLVPGRYTNAEL
jgi:hypothetical protein